MIFDNYLIDETRGGTASVIGLSLTACGASTIRIRACLQACC